LFRLLCRQDIADAAVLAGEQGDVRLATLIGSCGGGATASDDLRAQLSVWLREGRRATMRARRWRVLQLLAGDVRAAAGDVPWRIALALHSW
jgi:hypothetical protein